MELPRYLWLIPASHMKQETNEMKSVKSGSNEMKQWLMLVWFRRLRCHFLFCNYKATCVCIALASCKLYKLASSDMRASDW